jgi:hypothetical protein
VTDLNRPAGGTSLPAGASGQLNAVGGSGPDDLWAVGLTLSADQSTESLLLEHFNGTQWQNVPFPSQDIWAVGQTQQLNGAIQTLTAQFNGTAWAVVASPDPGNTPPDNSLDAVASAGITVHLNGQIDAPPPTPDELPLTFPESRCPGEPGKEGRLDGPVESLACRQSLDPQHPPRSAPVRLWFIISAEGAPATAVSAPYPRRIRMRGSGAMAFRGGEDCRRSAALADPGGTEIRVPVWHAVG